jgi:hypothetical protein
MLATFHDLHIDPEQRRRKDQGKASMKCGRHEDESLKHGKNNLHCINLFPAVDLPSYEIGMKMNLIKKQIMFVHHQGWLVCSIQSIWTL